MPAFAAAAAWVERQPCADCQQTRYAAVKSRPVISRPRGFWGGRVVYREAPRAPDRGLSSSFLPQPSFFKLVQISHPKCRPKVASSATELWAVLLHCSTAGGRWWPPTQQVSTTFPDFPRLVYHCCCKGNHPARPNLELNLDFVQDDTTGPFRARVARDSSRGASASSWATSAGATRSAR